MSDTFTFVFGLIATILAVGPLAIAAISEMRTEPEESEQSNG